jgi:hypothetical protein
MGQLSTEKLTLNTDTFKRLALSDSGFVFDPVTGKSYTVNDTGFWLIKQLQKNSNLNALQTQITHEFNGDAKIIERNVMEFLEQIKHHLQ